MAYVVARKDGRFEIRESIATERGPRARSLANFSVLTVDVLGRAEMRATRPFDRVAVASSAARRGAALDAGVAAGGRRATGDELERFAARARRFALAADGTTSGSSPIDPGGVLVELLAFADAVRQHQSPREPEPLTYPPLAPLVAEGRR
jgi:hypothetical protein